MACLFCGKEIGPIRILRDKEFCSPKHRKEYKDRLQKVLVQVGEPETVPRGVAPFMESTRASQGRFHPTASFDFTSNHHRAQLPNAWTLAVPEAGSSLFARLELKACDLSAVPTNASILEALPYFGEKASGALLSLPEPKLGTVMLRSADGRLVGEPISLRYPDPRRDSRPAESSAPAPLPQTAARISMPFLDVPAADCAEIARAADPAPSEAWMPLAAPRPAAPVSQPSMNLAAPAALHLPVELPQPAAAPRPAADEFETPPPVCEKPMAGLAATSVDRMARPAVSDPLPSAPVLRLPAPFSADIAAPRPEAHLAHLPVAAPEAVNTLAKPAVPPSAPIPAGASAPPLSLKLANPSLPAGKLGCLALSESEPVERIVQPNANFHAVAFSSAPLRLTPLSLELVRDPVPAPVKEAPAAAPAPPPRTASAKKPTLRPIDTVPTQAVRKPSEPTPAPKVALPPAAAAEKPETEIPQAGLLPVDYHSPVGPFEPRPNLSWKSRPTSLQMARFAVRPVFDRLEEPSRQKEERKKPAFAEIFTMPDAAALTKRKGARHAITAIAASVTVAFALWFGANAGKYGKDLLNREAADEIASASHAQPEAAASTGTASASTPNAAPAPSMFQHPVAWIKTEAAKRASVQLADSFDNGMTAWGARAKGMAPGWSHSADGYVRPGALALYQPTLHFTDYRMEFFGQIENKSMSWVVRGKDTQNYYAMKFNIVEPGLRPVIAMVHYPVVGGKQGHKVEVPLSVMVHNDTPYHVAVEVRGNHYTASIEGQEVDSWSDDTLMAGGVGFFAEAGSRARIYWMKVSKNDDWLGHLCNRIAGNGEPQDTAWLDRPALPVPHPDQPTPLPASAALWPAEAGETGFTGLQRGKGSVKGEMERWSS